MWNLYLAYEEEMHLQTPFDLMHELSSRNALPAPPPLNPPAGNPPNISTTDIGWFNLAYVESGHRSDVSKVNLQVTAQRDALGKFQANAITTAGGWEEESAAGKPETGEAKPTGGSPPE